MGWFGWSAEEALWADINVIEVAWIGRMDMFYTIFGGRPASEKPALDAKGQPIVLTAGAFDSMFGGSEKPKVLRRKPVKNEEE